MVLAVLEARCGVSIGANDVYLNVAGGLRIGEPAANPYLYFASQIYSGLDGMKRRLDPPSAEEKPYDSNAPMLPHSLEEAIHELRKDEVLREGFGQGFIDYYCRIKEAEIARYNLEVTEWEHKEYFELY